MQIHTAKERSYSMPRRWRSRCPWRARGVLLIAGRGRLVDRLVEALVLEPVGHVSAVGRGGRASRWGAKRRGARDRDREPTRSEQRGRARRVGRRGRSPTRRARTARRTTRTERREAERAPRDATGREPPARRRTSPTWPRFPRCVSLNCVDGEAVGRPADASKGRKSRARAPRSGVRRTNARVSDAARRARQCARRGRKSNGWGSFPRERTLRESQFRMSLMSGQDFKNV